MTPKSYAGRSGKNWAAIRKRVLETSDICALCGKPGADTVDHIIPRSIAPELAEDITNCRPAHRSCNSSRGTGLPKHHKHMPRSRQW